MSCMAHFEQAGLRDFRCCLDSAPSAMCCMASLLKPCALRVNIQGPLPSCRVYLGDVSGKAVC